MSWSFVPFNGGFLENKFEIVLIKVTGGHSVLCVAYRLLLEKEQEKCF